MGRIAGLRDAHAFLEALTVVLCVAAVTTVVFQRLRQPVVLGYLLAGLIVGPNVPIPLVADVEAIQTLSELGVILLMFSLGLEFRLGALIKVGPTAGLTAVVETSLMIWLGFVVGRAADWTAIESVFTGGILAISSTTIVAKAFAEHGVEPRQRELVVGILIAEDLIAILLMATLTAVSTGSGLTAGALVGTVAHLTAFLVGLVVIGMLIIPRTVRAIVRLDRPETTLVFAIGLCFAIALLADRLGYSVALGAFLAGSLVAESGEEARIARLVEPVRDVFAAIFFVAVGMLIDPALVAEHWAAVLVLTAVVIVGKVVGVSVGAFLTGNGTRGSIAAGMSLAQIGEFSFIIAGLGLSLGATGGFLFPVAVAVSALTTLATPWLIRAAGPFASRVDRSLPRSLQTFAALYGSWVERMRAAPPRAGHGGRVRRLVLHLLIDAAIVAALVIGAAVEQDAIGATLVEAVGLAPATARLVVLVGAFAASLPFLVGIARLTRRLGGALAEAALPAQGGVTLDLAAAPRRALIVALQVGVLMLLGAPLVALTQPFLSGVQGAIALVAALAAMAVVFWRSATNLQGHVRAGAEMIVEALAAQSHLERGRAAPSLTDVNQVLVGLGEPAPVPLLATSPAVGRTLAELDLRGRTGATVLAITRGQAGVLLPTAREVLEAGDVLAIAGTQEAIAAARALVAPATIPVAYAPSVEPATE